MDRRELKIIFMGTPEFAETNLKALISISLRLLRLRSLHRITALRFISPIL